jgi:DNA-binding NarL/FixJ family response regulator
MERKILLAEDHAIVIKGVKIIFETEFRNYTLDVVKNSAEMMRKLKTNNYEMAIIDLQLEDGDTFHLVGDILRLYRHLNVLIFTANPEEVYAQRLYKAGIKGYLNKITEDEEIARAIRQILDGKVYMSEVFKNILVANNTAKIKINISDILTTRELEVAHLMMQGAKAVDIGRELNMQPSTVATFKMKIFSKLNITNIIELKDLFKNFE